MKHTKLFRRSLAVLSAAAVGISTIVLVSADAKQKKKLLILGDSISAGYGLGENEKGYYDLLSECLDADLTNYAVSGYETKDVLAQLATAEIREAVKEADVICMSIGSNDLLHPTMEFAESLKESEDEDLYDVLNRLKESANMTDLTLSLTRKLREPIKNAQTNLTAIEDQVRALNDKAEFVMYTLYNPFETNRELTYDGKDYSESYTMFMDYVKGQEARISTTIKGLESVKTVDIASHFNGTGWVYLRDEINDIHPNPVGHAMFAVTTLGVLDGEKGKTHDIVNAINQISAEERAALPVVNKRLLLSYAVLTVADIEGKWVVKDEINSPVLTIKADGTYEITFKGSGTISGTVKVTSEKDAEGNLNEYYCFYEGNDLISKEVVSFDTLHISHPSFEDGFNFIRLKTPVGLFGDANGDGVLNSIDAKLVLDEHVLVNLTKGKSMITDENARYFADVNGDEKITDKDAKAILDYVTMERTHLNPSWYELTKNPNAPDAPAK